MKRYLENKPLNVQWISSIPQHWKQLRAKSIFYTTKQLNDDNACDNVLSLTLKGVIRNNIEKPVGLSPKDYCTYQIFEKDDLVFKLIDLENISTSRVGIVPEHGIMSPAYIRFSQRGHENIRYLFYQYYDLYLRHVYNGLGAGVRATLSASELLNIPIVLPPREEQDQIVHYLDWQVSKINRLIAAKRKEIALLKEHRTAKINQAVTTGIHCDTQLAYTGYNWLPYAPANWKPVPAKALFRNITELRRLDDSMLAATQKYGLIEQTEYMRLEGRRIVLANDNLDKWLHTEPNDFIISLRSFQGGLEMCSKPGCVTWHYVVLRSQRNIYPDFYKWFFKSAAYIGALQKTSDFIRDGQDLRFSNFVKVGLFIIPMDEQREIAEYLNREIPKYDVAISNLEKQIDQITELRTRLISDVVTGQVDMRDIKVPDDEYINDEITEEEFEEESENNEEE